MNKPLRRLFMVFVLMFGVLVGFTSWWTVFGAEDLEEKPSNRRPLLKAQKIPRGLILASDDTKLATNRRTGNRETKRYYRVYPQSRLFSHAVGYSYTSIGRAGLEKHYNDPLTGRRTELVAERGQWEARNAKPMSEPARLLADWERMTVAERRAALEASLGAVLVRPAKTRSPIFDPSRVDLVWLE